MSNDDTKQVRVFAKDLERLKNYGRVGDSMALAVEKVLDIAEKVKENDNRN
jgi:hypothetical protein